MPVAQRAAVLNQTFAREGENEKPLLLTQGENTIGASILTCLVMPLFPKTTISYNVSVSIEFSLLEICNMVESDLQMLSGVHIINM